MHDDNKVISAQMTHVLVQVYRCIPPKYLLGTRGVSENRRWRRVCDKRALVLSDSSVDRPLGRDWALHMSTSAIGFKVIPSITLGHLIELP